MICAIGCCFKRHILRGVLLLVLVAAATTLDHPGVTANSSSSSSSSASSYSSGGTWINTGLRGGIASMLLSPDELPVSNSSTKSLLLEFEEEEEELEDKEKHAKKLKKHKKHKKHHNKKKIKKLELLREPSALCGSLKGLSAGQTKLCQLSHDHMPGVARGAKLGIRECQHQFRHRRWNCSTNFDPDNDVFGPLLDIASRETGFVHAITAAGVVYTLGRACRDGQLSSCGCSRSGRPKNLNQEWIWGGCGDNLEYGYQFGQSFVDVRERERSYRTRSREHARSLMNLHNNEAGRRAVVKKSKVTCKCHGVSGSCSLITCWQQLASFREVGDYLLDKYDGATEVKINRRGRLAIKDPRYSKPTASDLVYLDESPNYCFANLTLGSLGTRGRSCNRTSSDIDGCNILCCGRGYNTQRSSLNQRCRCNFVWCCRVECSTCTRSLEIHTCK